MKPAQLKRIGKIINACALIAPNLVARFIFYKFKRPLNKLGFGRSQKAFLRKSNMTFSVIARTKIAHYYWAGRGNDNVLLIHGWESNSSRWESLIKLLQEAGFNIYAFDAPAHGFSEGREATPLNYAEVVDYFVKHHDIQSIVGHSFGGFTGIYYTANYGNTLSKLVAIAPTNSVADVVDGMQARMGFSDRCIHAFNRVFEKFYGSGPDHFRSSKFAKQISAKGLIIHDQMDNILPIQGSREIHDNWHNSKLVETSGLGHRTKSDEVNQEILSFLSNP